jgi:NADH-quinone oxidoreductase subunit J
MGSLIIFIIVAAGALLGAIGTVTSRNAMYSALFLVLNMAMLATFYLLLNAPFIAMVQLAVYAGAIMVLFLFVIMLLGAERLPGVSGGNSRWQVYVALVLGLVTVGILGFTVVTRPATTASAPPIDAGPVAVGLTLFEQYVFPFEVTSVVLLVAIIGVIVLRQRTLKEGDDA